jgi:hypothetical protein
MISNHTFRFSSTASALTTITRKNLLNLVLMANTAITTSRLFGAIRLRRVEIWTEPLALGSAQEATSLEWIGENSPSTLLSDTPSGITPAHIRTTPPKFASERWWCISGSQEADGLFIIGQPTAAAASTVDVSVDIRFVDNEAAVAGDVPAGASAGEVYYNYLDGIGGNFPPVGGCNVLP